MGDGDRIQSLQRKGGGVGQRLFRPYSILSSNPPEQQFRATAILDSLLKEHSGTIRTCLQKAGFGLSEPVPILGQAFTQVLEFQNPFFKACTGLGGSLFGVLAVTS